MSDKRGTCNNCERENQQLVAFGRCCLCYDAGRQAKKAGESIEAALAAVKERVKSGVDLKRKYRTKKALKAQGAVDQGSTNGLNSLNCSGKADEMKPVTYKIGKARLIPGVNVVSLEFKDERDKKIYDGIVELATEHRRDLASEIMQILSDRIDELHVI